MGRTECQGLPEQSRHFALLEKSIAGADATLTNLQAAAFAKTVEPWVAVLEHSAEHSGPHVAY